MTAQNPAVEALPPLIPREVLFGNPERADPRLSPDGTKLAYLAPDDGVLNVWVRTLGQDDDRVVTADRKRGIHIFFWQGDSRHILYMQDQDGDENFHLYQTNLETRETHDLTPFAGSRALPVAVDHNFPEDILVSTNARDARLFDVYRLHLPSRKLQLDTENPGDIAGWEADNALQVRAAQSQLPDGGTRIQVRDDKASSWREFTRWGPDESNGGVTGWTPDNQALLLTSSVGANAARLVQADLQTGAMDVIAEDPQYDVGFVLRHPRTHALEAVRFTKARREWVVLDPALQPDFDALGQVCDGDWVPVSRDLADAQWIVQYMRDNGPNLFYLYDRAARHVELLFSEKPALNAYTLSKMQPVSFPSRDGLTLHGYLTLPSGLAPKNLPLVLFVHGGPWGRDVWGYSSSVQHLANRGYAVLQINFRGSTGYGKAFLNAGDREWGGKMHDDLLDGKAWAIAQGYADPQKVAIVGGSYGGYATLAGLAFTPDEFACGVDIVGPSNLITLMRSIPPYWEPIKATFTKRVGDVETEEEFLKSRSPLFQAGNIRAPLLIAQGANDPRVKQAESDQIVQAMRANGQEVEYLVFPDEGHGFARPENNRKFWAAAEAFLAKHLGGRFEPPSDIDRSDDLRQ